MASASASSSSSASSTSSSSFSSSSSSTSTSTKSSPVVTSLHAGIQSGTVVFRAHNQANNEVYVVTFHTPLEDLSASHVVHVLDSTGAELQYSGIMAKRMPAHWDRDVLKLQPQQIVEYTIKLDDAFQLQSGKSYTVVFKKGLKGTLVKGEGEVDERQLQSVDGNHRLEFTFKFSSSTV